jgi:hypothetical protein
MADFENQNRDFLVSDSGKCGDSWPTGYRCSPRFSPSKALPHCRGSSQCARASRRKQLDRLRGRACQSGDLLFRAAGSLNPPAIWWVSSDSAKPGPPLSSGSRRIPSLLNKFNSGQTISQGATSFFRVSTFLRSSPGLSMGVSAMKAAWAMRRSLRRMRKGSRPMVPFPTC